MPETFAGRSARSADTSSTRRRQPYGPPWHRLTRQQQEQIRTVLAPVWHELPAVTSWEQRRIIGEVLAQLATGADAERLHDRVERRYARTTAIRSFPRWLIGAALVRHGCGDVRCETGTIWETGADCELCAVNQQVRTEQARREQDLAAAEERARGRRARTETEEAAYAEAVRLAAEQHRQAGLDRARLLDELAAHGEVLPVGEVLGRRAAEALPAAPPLPAKKSFRERELAPEGEIRAAIQAIGPSYALHVYGALRVLPLLNAPAPTGPEPVMPAPARVRRLADGARAAMGATQAGDLAAACPKAGCGAQPGQPCMTPRGRRRTDIHQARLTQATETGSARRTHAQSQ